MEIVALLCFLAKNGLFNHLGFDSSKWLAAAIYGSILLPYSLRNIEINNRKFPEIAAALVDLDPIYKKYGLYDFQSVSKAEQSICLRTLNFWAISKTKREIYENADSPESLCAFLETHKVKENSL
ncbi:MAG: hypothetical protein AB7S77_08085 [Desulfatirhabdiaceae bacterium]